MVLEICAFLVVVDYLESARNLMVKTTCLAFNQWSIISKEGEN